MFRMVKSKYTYTHCTIENVCVKEEYVEYSCNCVWFHF